MFFLLCHGSTLHPPVRQSAGLFDSSGRLLLICDILSDRTFAKEHLSRFLNYRILQFDTKSFGLHRIKIYILCQSSIF